MIHCSDTLPYGEVSACFIGRDTLFSGPNFIAQYEQIFAKFPEIRKLVYSEQVHGDRVINILTAEKGLFFAGEGDALLTREKNMALLIRTADCVPILFYSLSEPLLGAVHAGWRGLEKKILSKTLEKIRLQSEKKITDLKFIVGPFIREMSYEVGSEVAHCFPSDMRKIKENEKFLLNLRAILEDEFAALGIAAQQITWHAEDTLTDLNWHSARRGDAGRNFALIYAT